MELNDEKVSKMQILKIHCIIGLGEYEQDQMDWNEFIPLIQREKRWQIRLIDWLIW